MSSMLTMRIRFDSPLRNILRLGWVGFGLEEQCIKRFCKSVDGLSALLNLWRTASGECMTRRDINVDGVRGSKFARAVERIDGELGHCIFFSECRGNTKSKCNVEKTGKKKKKITKNGSVVPKFSWGTCLSANQNSRIHNTVVHDAFWTSAGALTLIRQELLLMMTVQLYS